MIKNIGWTLGNDCPCKCKHCYSFSVREKGQNLTREIVDKVISQIKILGVETVNLGGNEPIFTKKSKLEAIDSKTFEYCQKLKTINLPWDITIIGEQAFSYTGLTSIMLPMYLTYAGSEIFKGCDNLGSIGRFPTSQPITWAEDWIGCNNKIVCWGATYIDEYGEVYRTRN